MNVSGRFSPYSQLKGSDAGSGALSLLELRAFLGREWRLIMAVTAFGMLLGSAYCVVAPNKYTARTDMIIDTKKIVFVQGEMSSESRSIDDAAVESEIETTKSEKVAGAVVRRLNLLHDPEFVGSDSGLGHRFLDLLRFVMVSSHASNWSVFRWAAEREDGKTSRDDLMQRALATLSANLRVIRLGRSYHEEIAYTSLDPVKAATIANAFADAYIDDQLQAKLEGTQRASEWLQGRIQELRQQASDAYRAVQDYKSAHNIINGVDGKLTSDVELDQLGVELAKARAATSEARSKLDRITHILEQRPAKQDLSIPDPIVTDALSSPVVTKLRQQFLDDQNKMQEWSLKYGPNHAAVKNLRADMSTIQNSIWDEISRIAESYKSEYQIAKSQENAIDRRMTEVFQRASATRQSQVKLRELETAATSYRNTYETFLSRFTQSVQQQSFPSTEARIVTQASPPRKRSSPKIGVTLALATVCGLTLGIICGIGREQMDRRVYTPSQLESLLGITCLAVLPILSLRKTLARGVRATVRSTAFREISRVPLFSPIAEALRHIKVAIDLHPNKAKVIGVVSALPGEGKTTVATAFATFTAFTAFTSENGGRTLLIDADVRNPSMTRSLGHAAAPGLLNVAAGESDLDELLIRDEQYKFDFLPASTQLQFSNSSDVLSSSAVKRSLEAARERYDYVLVDLPPILPVVDVKALAHLFDAFILVVEWGSTSVDEVMKAASSSPILSNRLLGTVLNKADRAVMRRFESYSDRRYTYWNRG